MEDRMDMSFLTFALVLALAYAKHTKKVSKAIALPSKGLTAIRFYNAAPLPHTSPVAICIQHNAGHALLVARSLRIATAISSSTRQELAPRSLASATVAGPSKLQCSRCVSAAHVGQDNITSHC